MIFECGKANTKIRLKADESIIQLKEGQNILSVKDYPNLVYGFEMLNTYNGHDLSENFITKIDLSNFDTSKITDMSGIFHRCSSLKVWVIPKDMKDKSGMYEGCPKV